MWRDREAARVPDDVGVELSCDPPGGDVTAGCRIVLRGCRNFNPRNCGKAPDAEPFSAPGVGEMVRPS
jgi:hypothetical protein